MYSKPLTSAQLAGIATQQPINQQVGFAGMAGWIVSNSSPATFLIKDSNDTTQGVCAPWQITQGSFANASNELYLVADYTWPQPNPQSITPAQYQLSLETFTQALSPSSQLLASASAIPAMALDSNGHPVIVFSGTQSVEFPAAQSVNANLTGSTVDLTTNSTILNENISNTTSFWTTSSYTVTNLAAGATDYASFTIPRAMYDAAVLEVLSSASLIGDYQFGVENVYDYEPTGFNSVSGNNNFVTANSSAGSYSSEPLDTSISFYGVTFQIRITNISTVTITSDTLTLLLLLHQAGTRIVNPASSPVPVQTQYTTTEYNLGSYTFASTALAAGAIGTSQFTGSVPMTGVVKAQILAQQSAATGFVAGSASAGVGFQLQGSNDNSTWYSIAGDSNTATSFSIDTNGVFDEGADQSVIPSMVAGYTYVRWAIQLYNYTTASQTLSESCTVSMITVEG